MGAYEGHEIAESKGYDWHDRQTYGYMLAGAIVGGGTASLGLGMPTLGFSYLETAFVTSHLSNLGWSILTGGKSDVNYGYGPFNYNFINNEFSIGWGPVDYNFSNKEWDYLGKKENTFQDNLRFGLRIVNTIYRHRESLFTVDKSKTILGKSWQLTSRFTWEAPQTVIGMMAYDFYSTFGGIPGVDYHKGITFIKSKLMFTGISLANYVILRTKAREFDFQHEFGHTFQSRLLGPAYIPITLSGSLINKAIDLIGGYGGFYYPYNGTEGWATNLGKKRY